MAGTEITFGNAKNVNLLKEQYFTRQSLSIPQVPLKSSHTILNRLKTGTREFISGSKLILGQLLNRQPIKFDWRRDRLVVWCPQTFRAQNNS
jgi:hypothetical protein